MWFESFLDLIVLKNKQTNKKNIPTFPEFELYSKYNLSSYLKTNQSSVLIINH